MATVERVIQPTIADDGSVHYSSVMSPSDDSIAVCHMVPDRVIPVIFVPGVMGTNLVTKNSNPPSPIWLLDSDTLAGRKTSAPYLLKGAASRKRDLDPTTTDVYGGGQIPQGTVQSDQELRRRGWGEVSHMSYGEFLPWLENALNDAHACQTGLRAQLMRQEVAPGVPRLTHQEVGLSYRYQTPVHVVGYNWLQSNAVSAQRLAVRVDEIIGDYRRRGLTCQKVILVTHSMGGLVARYYSELLQTKEGVTGHREKVLGIVHAVMPTTGSATAYKRVKSGSDGDWKISRALGNDAARVTAVFAQSPGPLQLLPSKEYGMGWLQIKDGECKKSLPEADPYTEIYTKRRKWWGLIDDEFLNPLDPKRMTIEKDWAQFKTLIQESVFPFHTAMAGQFHDQTYAFYGDDSRHKTWGDVVWERSTQWGLIPKAPPLGEQARVNAQMVSNSGIGYQEVRAADGGRNITVGFRLRAAADSGDGTVPARSGRAPTGKKGVQTCVAYAGVDHEGAYKERPQQLFALWAITKIMSSVRGTSLDYKG